uniref:60S acidic ribosomal protein P0 n=1 Tax=Lineus viridis TaxID=56195 RepID=B0Z9P0_9BILA|nr:ribosomal protein rplp0 [Lineus viridis]
MVKEDRATWKSNYFMKIIKLLDEYPRCLLVSADNVGSKQMQSIRANLRNEGAGIILFGKNTMMRKAIRGHLENNPQLEKLLPHLKGNIGFVFTKAELTETRDRVLSHRVAAPAKAGALAPLDVTVPRQNTGLGPEKTSFFQALNIQTKITKGTVEIMNDVKLVTAGERVGASEAALLNMLKISPFSYGLIVEQVYDSGTVFNPAVLDITDDDLRAKFLEGVANVAAVSLAIGYPTAASAPHSIVNGFKNLLAISVETDYTFQEAAMTKEYLADPSKFAVAVPPTSAATQDAPKVEEKKEESEEESDDDMGFGLFD